MAFFSFMCFFLNDSKSFCCFLAVFWKPFSYRNESTVIGSKTSGGSENRDRNEVLNLINTFNSG